MAQKKIVVLGDINNRIADALQKYQLRAYARKLAAEEARSGTLQEGVRKECLDCGTMPENERRFFTEAQSVAAHLLRKDS